jgi:hypothetical protein
MSLRSVWWAETSEQAFRLKNGLMISVVICRAHRLFRYAQPATLNLKRAISPPAVKTPVPLIPSCVFEGVKFAEPETLRSQSSPHPPILRTTLCQLSVRNL